TEELKRFMGNLSALERKEKKSASHLAIMRIKQFMVGTMQSLPNTGAYTALCDLEIPIFLFAEHTISQKALAKGEGKVTVFQKKSKKSKKSHKKNRAHQQIKKILGAETMKSREALDSESASDGEEKIPSLNTEGSHLSIEKLALE